MHWRDDDLADSGNEARPRQFLAVHALRGQRRQLQERRTRIQQRGDALARQQLAGLGVLVARGLAAAGRIAAQRAAQIIDQPLHGGAVVGEVLRAGIELRSYFGHWLCCPERGRIVGQSDYPTILVR